MRRKWPDCASIAYFQAYTNTYGELEELKRKYEEALAVIGRLPPEVLKQYQGRSAARERETVSK